MKIILTQNVNNLGRAGDIKEVSDGYARNFLFPKKLAEIATPEAMRQAELKKAQRMEEEKKQLETAQKMAKTLQKAEIIIKAKEKGGKLFGSIGTKDIARALSEKYFEISEKSIILKEPIKKIGEYSATVKFQENVSTEVKVIVEPA
jgi:large subunit ribosomal protein L9